MMRELIDKVGFAWAVRALSMVMLVTLVIALALLKPLGKILKDVPMYDFSFLMDTPYMLFVLGKWYCIRNIGLG
jgi:hypothetical protein